MKRCGLLGEKLGHSYSPAIHAELADYEYRLYEVAPEKLGEFLTGGGFDGMNVTIPYKKAVIPYCAKLSPIAQKLQSVNVLVRREDGTLYGILSRTDIADYNMSRTNSGVLEEVPLFNAISVLEGKILNDAGESTDTISGEVTIALPQSRENLLFHSRESIVLCGNQPDMIRRALELNVSCLVLCQAEIS